MNQEIIDFYNSYNIPLFISFKLRMEPAVVCVFTCLILKLLAPGLEVDSQPFLAFVGVTVGTGVIFRPLNAVAQPLIGKLSAEMITQQKHLMYIAAEMTATGNRMDRNGFSNKLLILVN